MTTRKFAQTLFWSILLFLGLTIVTLSAKNKLFSFLEVHKEGVNGIDGLQTTTSVTISSDGRHLYVTGRDDNAVIVFSRGDSTGKLTIQQVVRDSDPGVNGLIGPYDAVVSPDGKHVYVASGFSNAVAAFNRDGITGDLTFIEREQDGLAGVDGLGFCFFITISPDGQHVYVASVFDDAIAVFSRDGTTGALTFVERQRDGLGGVDGLNAGTSVVVSPDGQHVYATGRDDNALTFFSRDSGTGRLTFQQVIKDGDPGIDGLNQTYSATISPDGKHVYVVGAGDNAVAIFSRDSTTGILTFQQVIKDGDPGISGLVNPRSIQISPDGQHAYVAGASSDTLVIFQRDEITGNLSFLELHQDGVEGVDGLDFPDFIAVSPNNQHVYVSSAGDDAVAVFSKVPELTLNKTVNTTNPLPGQRITYTLTVSNSSRITATNALISDTLPLDLTFAGPVSLNPPQVGANLATQTSDLPVLASNLIINPLQSITLTFPVTVNIGLAQGLSITNTAAVTSTNVTEPITDTATVTVNGQSNLAINKIVNPSTNITYQGEVTYTITLNNSGPVDASGAMLTDTLPISTAFARWVEQPVSANLAGNQITWNGIITTGKTITFTFVVSHTGDYGDIITNTAEYSHISGNGSDKATFIVEDAVPLLPTLSIGDATVTEKDAETSTATFNTTLSAQSATTVTVNYATTDGTATVVDNDYIAASGTMTFPPGNTIQTIPITIKGDTAVESDETFFVNLSNASGAAITGGQGMGTIANDDTASAPPSIPSEPEDDDDDDDTPPAAPPPEPSAPASTATPASADTLLPVLTLPETGFRPTGTTWLWFGLALIGMGMLIVWSLHRWRK